MLPFNKLQKGRLDRLKIYTGGEHPHGGQVPAVEPDQERRDK
jgi:ribosomal protein L13